MSYGKEIFRLKYKETMDSLNTIKDNYYALDQEYQWSSKEKDKEIERLQNIIKEVRELVENGTDFKSIYFKKDKEDLWKVILAKEVKEKYLEILDKEGDENE